MEEIRNAERLVAEALAKVDADREAIDPFSISSIIDAAMPERREGTSLSAALISELIAFRFVANYPDKESGWDSYFGPFMSGVNSDGTRWRNPELSLATPAVVDHWRCRYGEARHPVARARYADLCWEFGKRITGKKEPIASVRTAIDSYVDIANDSLFEHETAAIGDLKRALDLALSVRDDERAKAVKLAMIRFELRSADDASMGLWGFALETLSESELLESGEREQLIADLEDRLARVSDEAIPDEELMPQVAERAGVLLANVYRRAGSDENMRRVLVTAGNSYRRAARAASALVASAWFMGLRDLYLKYALSEEASALDPEIKKYGKQSAGEMKEISAEIKIDRDELDKYVAELTKGNATECLEMIAAHFLLRRTDIDAQLDKELRDSPLLAMMSRSRLDHAGRTVATVGSIEDDREGRTMAQIAQAFGIHYFFLQLVIDEVKKKGYWTLNDLVAHITRSPVFVRERDFLLRRGIKAYVEGDYEAAIHFLVPQFEGAVRTLGELLGRMIYRPGKHGGLSLRTLGELLRDEGIVATLGIDACQQFRALMTDPRAFNVRNSVCHGDAWDDSFGRATADWIVHAFLFMAMIRERREEADATP